jgi:taurine dioxygenase
VGSNPARRARLFLDNMKIQKLNQYFGANISEINLSDFSSYMYDDLKKLLIDFGVLVFENQKLNESDHLKFSKLWGKLQVHVLNQYNNRSNPEFFILSNFIDGKPKGEIPDPGAAIWHTDGSWSKNKGLVTILYSLKIPPIGGNTLFCDMKNALNFVNNDLLEKIENLPIIHDLNYSRTLTKAVNQMTDEQKKRSSACQTKHLPKHPRK